MNTRLSLVPLVIAPWLALHCGGGETTAPTTPTASVSASAPAPVASSSAAVVAPIQCPAPKASKPEQSVARPAACPDLSSADAVAKLDFAKAFKVDKKFAAALKENAAMELAMRALTTRVDASLKSGCAKLLTDFGCSGDLGDMQATCDGAAEVLRRAHARLGGAKVAATSVMPVCTIASQPALDCMKKCAPTFKGKADALVCDGKSDASGCSGMWSAPGISDACATTCAMNLAPSATCTPAQVKVTIADASDASAADQLKNALENDLHGALLVEAAHGRIDVMAKHVAAVMQALGPSMEHAEKTRNQPMAECYDPVTADEALATAQLGLESMVSLDVNASAVLPKK